MTTRSAFQTMLVGLGSVLLLSILAIAPTSLAQRRIDPASGSVQALITACDPITVDTTWLSGSVYVVQNCNLVIASGVTLTLQPGVIVKFGGIAPGYASALGSPALIVDGTVRALGTADAPVVFTSLADDSQGGDSNANGASSGQAGDWYGMIFRAGSTGTIEHAVIQYGGSGVFNAIGDLRYGRAQLDVRTATFSLRHTLISDGRTKGIYLEGSGLTPAIEDTTIRNNLAADGRGYAIYQSTIDQQPSYARLSLSGNDRDEVTIGGSGGSLGQDVTLAGTTFGFECGYTVCQLTVPAGRTLTVAPGTIVDFRPSFGLAVASGGSLIAEGSAVAPVTFTSLRADEYWMGIWAKSGSTLRLNYCEISYGSDGNFGMGGLEINNDGAEVRNCKIHHNRGYGLYLYSRSDGTGPINVTLQNVDVTDNGGHGVRLEALINPLTVTWDGGRVSENGWSGFFASTWQASLYPTLRNLTLVNNGALGTYADQRAGIYGNVNGMNPTLENLVISGHPGEAMLWGCNGSIVATNLQMTGNGDNTLVTPGCALGSGHTWDLGAAGTPLVVRGGIDVSTNGLLNLAAGTTLQFEQRSDGWSFGMDVGDQAALFALGTPDQPVRLIGTSETPGWWTGLRVADRAILTMRYCELAYGGSGNNGATLNLSWGLSGGAPVVDIQHCTIHHSGRKGVHFDYNNLADTTPPIFRNNQIYSNTLEGVTNWNAPALDARNNYWGDPSGPLHATRNPQGLGDGVGDNILFTPWLTAPPSNEPVIGTLQVRTGSPRLVSPGETTDYMVQYLNGRATTVRDGLIVVQLPVAAEYMTSTHDGIYWPERHQVFWRLGDLPSGAQGMLGFQVRFAWGLPRDFSDGSLTIFSAEGENPDGLDRTAYAAVEASDLQGVSQLSPAQRDAQLAAVPALQTAYSAALTEGYRYHSTANVLRADDATVFQIVLVKTNLRTTRIIALSAGRVAIYTITPAHIRIEDSSGGTQLDLSTGARQFWGAWGAQASFAEMGLAQSGCTTSTCKRNCVAGMVSWNYIGGKVGRVLGWTALAFFTGGGGAAGAVYEIGSTAKDLYDCETKCELDPGEHCCTAGQVRWSSSGVTGFIGKMTGSCYREQCGGAGMWVPDGFIPCTGLRDRCFAGIGSAGGCKSCLPDGAASMIEEQRVGLAPVPASACQISSASGGLPRCSDLNLRVAKDPNEIIGPQGDLLPGEVVTYTLTYENEGAGTAYGVYILNNLPAVFDETTLHFVYGTGLYVTETRELAWLIGDLAPKGATGSTGVLTYTVALRPGLPSGTIVANQAVVYFPSVPEETPTNTWINHVTPLVAAPQTLATNYGQALNLMLSGREVSGLPLTYALVETPRAGRLTGTAPNLSYTPGEGFVGPDRFSFTVSNGTSTSRPAEVLINVLPAGDTTAPVLLWQAPAANATEVVATTTPVFSDTLSAAYGPAILIGFSEALDPATLNDGSVTLQRGSLVVPLSLRFDAGANQIVAWPREVLLGGTYTVRVATSLTDLAGNSLGQATSWNFSVAGAQSVYLPLVRR